MDNPFESALFKMKGACYKAGLNPRFASIYNFLHAYTDSSGNLDVDSINREREKILRYVFNSEKRKTAMGISETGFENVEKVVLDPNYMREEFEVYKKKIRPLLDKVSMDDISGAVLRDTTRQSN